MYGGQVLKDGCELGFCLCVCVVYVDLPHITGVHPCRSWNPKKHAPAIVLQCHVFEKIIVLSIQHNLEVTFNAISYWDLFHFYCHFSNSREGWKQKNTWSQCGEGDNQTEHIKRNNIPTTAHSVQFSTIWMFPPYLEVSRAKMDNFCNDTQQHDVATCTRMNRRSRDPVHEHSLGHLRWKPVVSAQTQVQVKRDRLLPPFCTKWNNNYKLTTVVFSAHVFNLITN